MNVDDENLQGQCLGPEGLGAYVDGKLTSEEEALIESHLVKCNRCRRIIELVIESGGEVPSPTLSDSSK
jgi:anti-sigma factor RsiW